jgi:aryl-alcohol dehydrogenase-like predicted oxidoreductase
VDVYFLHNPETQLGEVPREEFERRLCRAFEVLEDSAARGRIRYYGTATWQAYRASPEAPEYLSLARVVALARDVGGEGHRFRVIQLPYNLAMAEAFGLANQEVGGEKVTLLEAAARLGISVVASVPLYQARLARGLPPDLRRSLGLDTDAQRAIQFVRSTPGITAPLVGMKRRAHLEENLEVSKAPPIAPEQIASLFRSA